MGDAPTQPTKTINLHLTDDDDATFRICLERADGSFNFDDENGQDEDNIGGGDGEDEDHSGNNDSNADSQNSTPPPPPPTKRRRIFEPQEDGQKRQSGRLQTQERKNYKAAHQGPPLPRLTKRDQARSKAKEPEIRDTINMDTGDIVMSATTRPIPHIPQSYEEAIAGPDREMWLNAMIKEIKSAMALRAWDLVGLPNGVKPIDGKWVYAPKTDVNGNFVEAKARWVARGFQQVKGVDYDETYAATIRPDTTRTLLAIAAAKGWKVHQADVSVAYLHAHQKDYQIYLRQPKGFEHGDGDLYCRMDKGLYGLKQSGNLWFDEAAGTLVTKLGLTQSKYDPALFFNKEKQLYVTLYVDDFKAISPDEKVIKWFMKEFGSVYKIKDLGLVSNYLGMEITQANGTIKVTQRRYLQHVLQRFQMKDCKRAKLQWRNESSFTRQTRTKNATMQIVNYIRNWKAH